jgi:hypothetical protein
MNWLLAALIIVLLLRLNRARPNSWYSKTRKKWGPIKHG